MHATRPSFIDLDSDTVAQHGFDIVEPKHDGMWVTCTVKGGVLTLLSRSGNVKLRVDVDLPNLVAAGEYIRGTTWSKREGRNGTLVLFDALQLPSWWFGLMADVSAQPLHKRRRQLSAVLSNRLPNWISIVPQYGLVEWESLWNRLVTNGDWEGLVFKHSSAPYGEPWGRLKRVVTHDFVCLGVREGKGRLKGVTGSLSVGTCRDGAMVEVMSIGSGLSDAIRRETWQTPAKYIGRTLEAAGNGMLPSGALRHPRFIRFRSD